MPTTPNSRIASALLSATRLTLRSPGTEKCDRTQWSREVQTERVIAEAHLAMIGTQ